MIDQVMKNGLAGQIVRYAISGAGITLFYSIVYLVCLEGFEIAPLIANSFSFLLSVGLGYVIHSRWSFKGHGSRDTVARNTIRFLIVNLICFALNSFWVWLIAEQMDLSPRLPLLPIIFITPWLGFWLNRRWTFG